MDTLEKRAKAMFRFRDLLTEIGFNEQTVADAIRIGGTLLPVFGVQLQGCYYQKIDNQFVRVPHFALPGWYRLLRVDGNSIVIQSVKSDEIFDCGKSMLLAVLGANLECVEKGVVP